LDSREESYQFHLKLESPSAFFRREWKPVLIFGGGFCAILIAAVFLIDPAFFYPRIQTDPLNYLLKARALIETGTTSSARWAVNASPFAYSSMAGILRVPFLLAFSDFDDQLRAIQISNVFVVAAVALLSAYIFSWTQPVSRHWLTIAFSFVFMMLSPVWIANVFLPLTDAPYALFTMVTLLLTMELACSGDRLFRRPVLTVAIGVLFVISFMLRFTAPIMLAFPFVLLLGRWQKADMSKRAIAVITVAVALFLVVLVKLNRDAIFGRYLHEPLAFVRHGDKDGMIVNLLGAAIPSQVIPSFQLGFRHPPINGLYHTAFGTSLPDAMWVAVGVLMSCVIVAGMWVSRKRLLPEIAYVVLPLPLLALMLPSTTRYLMSYQAFFWIFFWAGAAVIASRVPQLRQLVGSRTAILAAVAAMLVISIGLRSWKVVGSLSERHYVVTIETAPAYIRDVSSTFRSLREYLETLPRDRSILIGGHGSQGRWKVISGFDYYRPDHGLLSLTRTKDVYLVIECGTREICTSWDWWKEQRRKDVTRFGAFSLDSAFAAATPLARVQVDRVRARE
jgi:hypothetical protein